MSKELPKTSRSIRQRLYLGLTSTFALFGFFALNFFVPHLSVPASAAQTIPYKINYQGRLTDSSGNIVANGSYNIKFTIYNAPTGGTNLWQEYRQTGNRVTITNGLFDVRFGDVTALSPTLFDESTQLYLEVELPTPATATCSTSNCASFTEGALSPRQPIAASPYAFNADMIDGIDGVNIAQLNQANTFTANQTVSGSLSATSLLQGGNTVCDTTNNCNYAAASGSNNYIQNGTSTQTGNFALQSSGSANVGGLIKGAASQTANLLLLQDSSSNQLAAFNSSGNLTLGRGSGLDGKIVFNNAVNNNTLTLQAGATTSNITFTLPTAAGSSGECLKATDGSGGLGFGSCAAGSTDTLQQSYNASSGGSTPEVKLDSTRDGLDIQDSDTTTGDSLLNVRASNGAGLGAALFSVGNTGSTTLKNSSDSTSAFLIQL
jgi:hypothetical protein